MMQYDFGFIGLGAANGLLLIELNRLGLLDGKSILIIDPDLKEKNDKTYCFWADPRHTISKDLKHLVTNHWEVLHRKDSIEKLEDHSYYMVESITLYKQVKKLLRLNENVTWVQKTVKNIAPQKQGVCIQSSSEEWLVNRVYDSRPPAIKEENGPLVLQSFLGWKVKLETPYWNANEMTLMDFDIPQDDYTQFIYVLPTSETEALVEMTRFGKDVVPEQIAISHIESYLNSRGVKYSIEQVEKGVIPMSQCLESGELDSRIIPVGARAGKIKSTTGYAFKNMYEHAVQLGQSLLGNAESTNIKTRKHNRFAFYDKLLLHILKFKPQWGKEIFEKLFSSQNSEKVFVFLDEKSTLTWELKMFSKLPVKKFLWALFSSSLSKSSKNLSLWASLVFAVMALGGQFVFPDFASVFFQGILLVLLLFIGIPHGALDGFSLANSNKMPKFILSYLLISALVLLLWMASPMLGLVLFLIFSAWHFGETDLKEWGVNSIPLGFLWGVVVLIMLLIPHLDEVNQVLSLMSISEFDLSLSAARMLLGSAIGVALLLGFWFGSLGWFIAIATLGITAFLPLGTAFGIYFILQHSFLGWNHLKVSNHWTHLQMWKMSTPFTLGALVLFVALYFQKSDSILEWTSYFFVFLSAISLPHIYFMSKFYRGKVS